MRRASFGAVPSQKAAMVAAGTKETNMRTYPLSELLNLTRAELVALQRNISDALAHLPEDSPERFNGRATLRNIHWILDRRGHGTGLVR
jgi:hypothetical protein